MDDKRKTQQQKSTRCRRLQHVVTTTAIAALGGLPIAASGQTDAKSYPNKLIRVVVPSSAGGGLDTLARVTAKKLTESMGQTILVDNRPGAGGNIGMDFVARAAPDGYTILVGNIELATAPSLHKSLSFDPLRDFTPITMGVNVSNILVVHPSLPVKNARELIALAKARPGALNFSSGSTGSLGHLAGELFSNMAKVVLVHIPYKGGGLAMSDLLAGQVQLAFSSPATAIPQVTAGKLRALGVTTTYKLEALPNVPTISESGLPGYEAKNWYVLVAPAKTPRPMIAKLNQEFQKALTAPDVKTTLVGQGMDPAPGTPEELGTFLQSETLKWQKVIKATNLGGG